MNQANNCLLKHSRDNTPVETMKQTYLIFLMFLTHFVSAVTSQHCVKVHRRFQKKQSVTDLTYSSSMEFRHLKPEKCAAACAKRNEANGEFCVAFSTDDNDGCEILFVCPTINEMRPVDQIHPMIGPEEVYLSLHPIFYQALNKGKPVKNLSSHLTHWKLTLKLTESSF